ncbi:MAG: aminotransferase class I/II-fold pyridoxal phosphate-dependent enzyme [Gemmatimonadota bacterium]|nr:MAG: aminotransferase class I/II-fold pyridoxal phosphate-dependent enzyme [Gemmatimonadota bacterium]
MRTAHRTHTFTESVIREMTRVANQHGAINLAQGFPDFAAPELLKEAAVEAIRADINQYAITWGTPRLRNALAEKYRRFYSMEVDTEREIVVTCGATEAMASAMLALVDPGEEIIIYEPFYENYGPDSILCGAKPVFVPTRADGGPDLDATAVAFSERTRGIIINTPNNPTGHVFARDELETIARLCIEHDAIAFTDEIYEHILYEGEHVPMAALDGMRERTVTVSGASKTFSITGWRIGTIVAPPTLTDAIKKTHDFLTVGAPAPLQEAVAAGIEGLDASYYSELADDYRRRRDVMYDGLSAAGFSCRPPAGSYYILADFSSLSDLPDDEFAVWLAREHGVASVPGSSFYSDPADGRTQVRFAFCKSLGTLERAAERLAGLGARGRSGGAT